MNRIHTACCALTASALVLAGLLAICVGQRTAANEADASMVIAGDDLTLMTAQTRSGEESFFVLDNASASLIVYRLDVSRDTLEPAAGLNLDEIFNSGNNGDGRGRRGNRR